MSEVTIGVRMLAYKCLTSEYPFEEQIDIAQVATALHDNGIEYGQYGYMRLRPFLEEIGTFIELTEVFQNGTQVKVVLHEVTDWGEVAKLDPQQDGAGGRVIIPESYDTAWAARVAKTARYSGTLPDDMERFLFGDDASDFASFCHVPPALSAKLSEILPANTGPLEVLSADWHAARSERAVRFEGGNAVWPLHIVSGSGTPRYEIAISVQPLAETNPAFKPWIARGVSEVGERKSENDPMAEFGKFASIAWGEYLDELAGYVQEEPWDFDDGQSYSLLKTYVALTFYRLKCEDKIAINRAGTFAAFNTGLASSRYEDVYACFEKGATAKTWKPSGFCVAGASGLGKKLVRAFGPLPSPASYFVTKDDLFYDLDRDLVIDYAHILVDNVDRLPLEFIGEETGGSIAARSALDAISTRLREGGALPRKCAEIDALRSAIEHDPQLFRRLRCRLDDVVTVALRRQRWDYRTATPGYYARANKVTFLLPLDFLDDGVVDDVLVVSSAYPSKNYIGETVLTMPQAYGLARLVAQPSGWLVPTAVTRALDKNTFVS